MKTVSGSVINRAAAFAYGLYALGLPQFQDTLVQLAVGSSTGAMLTLISNLRTSLRSVLSGSAPVTPNQLRRSWRVR